jgi:hypothetical protein
MRIDIQRYWGDREIYFVGELCCKIIESMQTDSTVTLFSKEPRSARVSGLYNLLDQLVAYHGWCKSDITLETVNQLENHLEYSINVLTEGGGLPPGMQFYKPQQLEGMYALSKIEHRQWNREKTYGMFLGRANVTRIFGVQQHKKFQYVDQGLVSWHHNTREQVDTPVLVDFLTATGQTYDEMVAIAPFSDIGPLLTPPISNMSAGQVDWNRVYEQIGIELVFETSEHEEALSFTEKLLRPMLYKRPFMIVSGRNSIHNLKKHIIPNVFQKVDPGVDMRFFEHVIPMDYDADNGIHRVTHVFDILRSLILSEKINTILEDCQEDLEINYNLAQSFYNHPGVFEKGGHSYQYDTWARPVY